jgi:hypothetical protein
VERGGEHVDALGDALTTGELAAEQPTGASRSQTVSTLVPTTPPKRSSVAPASSPASPMFAPATRPCLFAVVPSGT